MGEVLHIRQDIPSKLLSMNQDIARFFIVINLLNKKKIATQLFTQSQESRNNISPCRIK